MGTVEKIAAGMGALIALYLVVYNANGSNTVLNGLGSFNVSTITALLGRLFGVGLHGKPTGDNPHDCSDSAEFGPGYVAATVVCVWCILTDKQPARWASVKQEPGTIPG